MTRDDYKALARYNNDRYINDKDAAFRESPDPSDDPYNYDGSFSDIYGSPLKYDSDSVVNRRKQMRRGEGENKNIFPYTTQPGEALKDEYWK